MHGQQNIKGVRCKIILQLQSLRTKFYATLSWPVVSYDREIKWLQFVTKKQACL